MGFLLLTMILNRSETIVYLWWQTVFAWCGGKFAPNNNMKPVRDNRQLRHLKIESQRRDGQEREDHSSRWQGLTPYFSRTWGGKCVRNVSTNRLNLQNKRTSPRTQQDTPEYKRGLCEFHQQAQKPGTRCLGPSMDPSAILEITLSTRQEPLNPA
jgi:hypothetical protein